MEFFLGVRSFILRSLRSTRVLFLYVFDGKKIVLAKFLFVCCQSEKLQAMSCHFYQYINVQYQLVNVHRHRRGINYKLSIPLLIRYSNYKANVCARLEITLPQSVSPKSPLLSFSSKRLPYFQRLLVPGEQLPNILPLPSSHPLAHHALAADGK